MSVHILVTAVIIAGTRVCPSLEITGFSKNGEFLAYTLSGEYEGSAFPYCELHILDCTACTLSNSFTGIDQSQSISSDEFRMLFLDSMLFQIEMHGIRFGDTGVFIDYPAIDSPPEALMLSFLAPDSVTGLEEGLYSLDLFQSPADTSVYYRGMHPSTCQLNLTRARDCATRTLLDWIARPAVHELVYKFDIGKMLIHPSGFVVVFLECTVEGFEVPGTEILPLVFRDLSLSGPGEV